MAQQHLNTTIQFDQRNRVCKQSLYSDATTQLFRFWSLPQEEFERCDYREIVSIPLLSNTQIEKLSGLQVQSESQQALPSVWKDLKSQDGCRDAKSTAIHDLNSRSWKVREVLQSSVRRQRAEVGRNYSS